MLKITLAELKAFVTSYVAEAKQAGSWNPTKDEITGLIEKVVAQFNLDNNGYVDRLPELDGQERAGIIEEYATGLVPATGRPHIADGAANTDELSPAYPEFDEPSYSYPLVDATNGKKGIRFKTTIKDLQFDEYVLNGNEDGLVNYIIKKLYDSFTQFKYQAKRQLIGNFINKAVDAQAGETYTTNSTIIKCGHIYVQSNKFYIAKKNFTAAVNKSLATLAGETPPSVKEITPDLVKAIAKPVDTNTGEAFIKEIKDCVEKLTIDASEGTSLSGSTIGANNSNLRLYVLPKVVNSLDVDTLAGAFNVDKLAIPAVLKTLPDFGIVDDSGVFAVLMDERGCKLFENYMKANATMVNGDLYTNYFLHYGATAFISKHTAIKVFTTTGLS